MEMINNEVDKLDNYSIFVATKNIVKSKSFITSRNFPFIMKSIDLTKNEFAKLLTLHLETSFEQFLIQTFREKASLRCNSKIF